MSLNLGQRLYYGGSFREVPIADWALLAYDVEHYFHRAFKDIKNGALLDTEYYQGSAINKAMRYGERE